jgi:myo-inositol 2-dehydrogenase / D-chiro-inositol 1-dehydrogenase
MPRAAPASVPPVRAAVVGTNWGRVHVAALREAGVEVVALAGADAGTARAVAGELGIPAAVTDLDALRGLHLDLVAVATPAPTHAAVIDALPDVPVLCEKPAVGLAAIRGLAPRAAPVWVNYAFAFLDVARRAGDALAGIGALRSAAVISSHDLPALAQGPAATFLELVPHPWSWLVTLLGPVTEAGPAAHAPGEPVVAVRCGGVPVTLAARHEPGLGGLRHAVVLVGERGRLTVAGRYRIGEPWRFDPPRWDRPGAPTESVGEPEEGPGDPWYRANARAVAAVVAAVRGEPASPLLFDWDRALALDRAAQAGLVPG